jgi:hypothetical protein
MLRAAVNEGEGNKTEIEPNFIDRHFLRYYISGIRNVLVQRVPRKAERESDGKSRSTRA